MAKTKAGSAATKALFHSTAAKAPKFKAPTASLKDVIFKYRTNMKPGSFQGYINSLSGRMASLLKQGRAQAMKAIRNFVPPNLQEPTAPDN